MDLFDFIPMLAGAGMQAYAQRQALNRQQAAIDAARARQLQVQDQASQVAARAAAAFDPATRQAQQAQIQQQLTAQLSQPIGQPQVTAQGVQVGQTLPEGAGGTDYLVAKARETAKAQESARALAALMGRQGAATQLRRDESVGLADADQQIGSLGTHAQNLWTEAKPGIEMAGAPNVGMLLGAEALRQYGTARIAQSGLKQAPVPDPVGPAPVSGPLGSGLWSPAQLRKIPFKANQGGALGSGTFLLPDAPY